MDRRMKIVSTAGTNKWLKVFDPKNSITSDGDRAMAVLNVMNNSELLGRSHFLFEVDMVSAKARTVTLNL